MNTTPTAAGYSENYIGWTITVTTDGRFSAKLGTGIIYGNTVKGVKKKINDFNTVASKIPNSELKVLKREGYGHLSKLTELTVISIRPTASHRRRYTGKIVPIFKDQEGKEREGSVYPYGNEYLKPDPEVYILQEQILELTRQTVELHNRRDVLERQLQQYTISQDQIIAQAQAVIKERAAQPRTTRTLPLLANPGFDNEPPKLE